MTRPTAAPARRPRRGLSNVLAALVVLVACIDGLTGGSIAASSAVGSTASTSGATATGGSPSNDQVAAIKRVLQAQTDAWNRGDLKGYMAGYWKSEDLTFYSGGTVTLGWQATLERYRRRYQGEGHAMGRLDFPDEVVEPLGPDAAVARGHYHLVMPDNKELQGLYTVILKRLPEGWRIVHDHSSSE